MKTATFRPFLLLGLPGAFLAALLAGCGPRESAGGKVVLRVGHFPNVTHAQALVAHALSERGKKGEAKGWFEERLGPDVEIQWFVYNAGPSAMEAIFARSIDLAYVGPNPALNAHIKSRGAEVRVIAGSAVGGAALVVQGDGSIKTPADLRGRRVATPQLGNTQDVACRAWLRSHGFEVTQTGGDVLVVPTENPEQLSLFKTGDVDAVWTVEPWVSRLVMEGGGKVFLEENDAVTTILVARAGFLEGHRELVRKFAAAHAELTEHIRRDPGEAKRIVAGELERETTRAIPPDLLSMAWERLRFSSEVQREALEKFVAAARSVGFLRGEVDLSRFWEKP